MEKITFTRQSLYDLVWSEPLSVIAKSYNISVSGLRKICIRMNIPLPPNGHWQKVRFGKHTMKTKLSDNYTGENEITLSLHSMDDNGILIDISPHKRLTIEIENDKELPIKVPLKLTDPDKLIIAAKKA